MKKLYGHGDVIVKEIDEIPKNANKMPYTDRFSVLAYGEISGHAHCLEADKTELFKDDNGQVYLRCNQDVELKHQKLDGSASKDAHGTIVIPKKDYKIDIKREYCHFLKKAREVAD